MLNKLEKKDFAFAGLAFFAAYLAYLFTAYPTVTTEDSGEFIAAVYHLGVAHPPGYPLYVFLAKIFTLLVPFGNIGWRVNIFSAFCGALTVAAIFLLLKKIVSGRLLPLIGALAAASVTVVWTQAIRAEVYTLNSFLLATVILLLISWFSAGGKKSGQNPGGKKYLLWTAFLLGLGLANHQLMYLAGIPAAVFVLAVNRRIILQWKTLSGCLLVFALGFSFNFYLPLRAAYQPEINWNNPAGWNQMWEHITRDFYYRTAEPQPDLYLSATAQPDNPVFGLLAYDLWGFNLRLLGLLADDFSFLIIPLLLAGFIYIYNQSRPLFLFFTGLYIFYGPVAAHLINLGNTAKLPYVLHNDLPFFLPVLVICVIIAVCGAAGLAEMLKPPQRRTAVYALGGLIVFNLLILKMPALNQSGNYLVYDIVKTAFGRLPENSVLLLEGGDNTIFPLLYIQKVERYRPDIKVYITAPINLFNFANNYPDIIRQNPGRPLYVDYYFRDEAFSYDGMFGRYYPDRRPDGLVRVITSATQDRIRGIDSANLDHFNKYSAANYYVSLGMSLNGDQAAQKEYFDRAIKTAPGSANLINKYIGNFLAQMNRFPDALPFLEEAVKWMPDDYNAVFQLILSSVLSGKADRALEIYQSLNAETQKSMKGYLQNIAAQTGVPPLADFLNTVK